MDEPSQYHMRGYSSGASSVASVDSYTDDLDNQVQTGVDRVGLEVIKSNLLACGEGNCNVRMETPLGKPIDEVYEGVHDGPILGSGVSGIVREVTHKSTGVHYAVKCLDLGLVKDQEGLERLREEIYIMCQLDYPNIVQLVEAYESDTEIYLIQHLCSGGDLFDRLDQQPEFHYTEAQCCRLVKQMLSAVRYLHRQKIIHRDLKLENFLFSSNEKDSELQMIDFGLSKHFSYVGEEHHEAVGTPYSVAPEVIRGSYDEKCDIWSIGVITYLLLCGETPFGGCCGEDLLEVRSNILSGKFAFEPPEFWEHVSDVGKDFVKSLLVVDPKKRPSAKEAQRHPWIQLYSKKEGIEGNKLNPNVVKAIVGFKELSDMQKLLSEVLSFSLLPEQITDLREEFAKIDNGDGEITLEDLRMVLMENAEAGSLGALTEEEVEDIFLALRVRKTEQTIRWHDFIAAGLSQCQVDDRNLRLAFNRLDTKGKGFITLDDVMELMGSSRGSENEEYLREIWKDAVDHTDSRHDCITYEDFLLLMKGQPQKVPARSRLNQQIFGPIPENGESFSGLTESGESLRRVYKKMRSRSMDHTTQPKRTRLLNLQHRNIQDVMSDESQTPLKIHRNLYRAHREMRLAVLEASKRFEEEQAKRQKALPMQRDSTGNFVSDKKVMSDRQMKLDAASQRGGRADRTSRRKKTVSDVSGLF